MPNLDAVIDAAADKAFDAAKPETPEIAAPTPKAETTKTAKTTGPAVASGSEATPTPAPKPGGSQTTLASADDGEQQDTQWLGIPEDKRNRILENTRSKTEQAIREEYGYTKDEWPRVHGILRAMDESPVEFVKAAIRQLQAQGLWTEPKSDTPTPQTPPSNDRRRPSLRAEDGTHAYSAEDVDAILTQQEANLLAKFEARFGPIEQRETQRTIEAMQDTATKSAKEQLAEAETWEGFKDLRKQVLELMKDGRVTLESAYLRAYTPWKKEREKHVESETRQKVLAELKAQPSGPTKEVAPGAAHVSTRSRKPSRSFDERVDNKLAEMGFN